MNHTKQAIAQSFMALMQQKPVSKITICDIAGLCGVSRMTFYYHFRDIYDLVEWIFEENVRSAVDRSIPPEDWQKGLLSILRAVQENRSFILKVYHSTDRPMVEKFLLKMIDGLLTGALRAAADPRQLSPDCFRTVVTFYKYAMVGTIQDWIAKEMQQAPQEIVDAISILSQSDFLRDLGVAGAR